MRIWIRNTAFSMQICWFALGLRQQGNCGFADSQICGFAICGLIITNLWICDLRTGTSKKFSDLRLRNEPKNLRTNKKICVPTFLGLTSASLFRNRFLLPTVTGSLLTSHSNLRKSKDGKLWYMEMIKLSNAYRFLLPKQRLLRQRKMVTSTLNFNNLFSGQYNDLIF